MEESGKSTGPDLETQVPACPRWSVERGRALLGGADLPPALQWTEQLPSSPLCESEHRRVLRVSEQGTEINVTTAFY